MTDSSDSAGDNGTWEGRRQLLIEAYSRYLDELRAIRSQSPGLTDYAASHRAGATKGTMPWFWSASGELREAINSMNAWGRALHSWNAWNRVVASYNDLDDRCTILNDTVEPIAFFCMLQPSNLADRIVVVAEALLHQANLAVIPGYIDRLDQDKGGLLRRKDRRAQLNRLGQSWTTYRDFGDALAELDGQTYRLVTQDFRDRSAHSFAPRMMIGEIARAIREVVPWTDHVEQPDGTFADIPHPTHKAVRYGMGSMQPLRLESMQAANLEEYLRAKVTMAALAVLVDELCNRMDEKPV